MAYSPLLEALWREQGREGLSDGALARKLGLSIGGLSLLKSGKRGLGIAVQTKIIRAYPHLLVYLLPAGEGEEETAAMRAPPSRPR